jgi:hypothetical protein
MVMVDPACMRSLRCRGRDSSASPFLASPCFFLWCRDQTDPTVCLMVLSVQLMTSR